MHTTINTNPLIFTLDNYLTIEQCNEILRYNWKWENSTGYDHKTHSSKPTSSRTSSTAHVNYKELDTPQTIKDLNTNLSQILNIEKNRLEKPQLQKYDSLQHYAAHWDYFFTGPHLNNNRTGTVIIYLNDNFIGGTTSFPNLNQAVRPKQGMLLYFEYTYDDETNILTMHSGDPVIQGTKYIINVWIRKNKWA